jgi:hypothetical protein
MVRVHSVFHKANVITSYELFMFVHHYCKSVRAGHINALVNKLCIQWSLSHLYNNKNSKRAGEPLFSSCNGATKTIHCTFPHRSLFINETKVSIYEGIKNGLIDRFDALQLAKPHSACITRITARGRYCHRGSRPFLRCWHIHFNFFSHLLTRLHPRLGLGGLAFVVGSIS